MEDRWTRLEEWIETDAPALASRLRPPATEAEIEATEADLGITFPPSVRRSYLVHDGEDDGTFGVLGYRHLPLSELVETALTLRRIDEDFDYDFWGDSLVPLFAVGNGDYLCVYDAIEGRETAFLRWDHESSVRDELEPSFAAYFDAVLDAYEAGDYDYDAERGWLTHGVSIRRY